MGQTKDQLSRRRRKLTPLPTAPVLTSEQTEAAKNNLSQQLQGQNQSALKENLQNTTAGRVKEASVAPGQSIQPQAVQAPKPQPLVIKPKDNNVLSSEQATAERNRIATETQTALTQNPPEEIKKYNLAQMNKMIKAAGEEGEAKRQETEDKRRRRIALFNALGDGISALSNLYFTSKGAPSVQYDPRGSLSARQQARWDAIDANRKAEEEKAYVRQQNAIEKDIQAAKEREAKKYQAERDRIADERYKEEKARQDRQRAEDVAYREAQAQRDQEKWEAQLAAQERNAQATQAGLNYRAQLSSEAQKAKAKESSAKAKRGKPLQFSDGDSKVSIYENVWKPSMQQVYEAIRADGVGNDLYNPTAAQVEHFVKQNWNKSAKAKELMRALSQIDPAAEYDEVEDYSQYEVVGDEDYSQYEVK